MTPSMNEQISFRDYLDTYGVLTYPVVGVSMLPLLHQDRDLVTVERRDGRFAPGDVVLYERKGRFILHRVVKTREKDYVILGDNCISFEYGTTDQDILGVMTHFVRNGKEYSTDDWRYRAYTFWILHTASLRILLRKAFQRFRKFGSRVKRKLLRGDRG